jgi:hypothetical protein
LSVKFRIYSGIQLPREWVNKSDYMNILPRILSDNNITNYLKHNEIRVDINPSYKSTEVNERRAPAYKSRRKSVLSMPIANNTSEMNKATINNDTSRNIKRQVKSISENTLTKNIFLNKHSSSKDIFIKEDPQIYEYECESPERSQDIEDHLLITSTKFSSLPKIKRSTTNQRFRSLAPSGKRQLIRKLTCENNERDNKESDNYNNSMNENESNKNKSFLNETSVIKFTRPEEKKTSTSKSNKLPSIVLKNTVDLLCHQQEQSQNNIKAIEHKNKKIRIKNQNIQELLNSVSDAGYYAPYFSLCRNCNDRNNQFYNKMTEKNAKSLIELIRSEKGLL